MRTGRFHKLHPKWYTDFECCTDVGLNDVIPFHRAREGYKGPGFLLAKDVVKGVHPHDGWNDVIKVGHWPAMKKYIDRRIKEGVLRPKPRPKPPKVQRAPKPPLPPSAYQRDQAILYMWETYLGPMRHEGIPRTRDGKDGPGFRSHSSIRNVTLKDLRRLKSRLQA